MSSELPLGVLDRLNHRMSQWPAARWIGLMTFVLSLACYLTYYEVKFGLNVPPSTTGDEPSYDSLGWQLSRGRGFTLDFGDNAFRAPYDRAARNDPDRFTLPEAQPGLTTIRPPLFPVIIAGTDLLFGRQFWAVRVVNAAAMAATNGLVAHFLFSRIGLLPALLGSMTFLVIDYRSRLFGRAIMTEALACLLVALLLLSLVSAARSRRLSWGLLAGALMGLLVLTRTIFAIWVPAMAILLFLGVRAANTPGTTRRGWWHAAMFVVAAALVVLPWGVRNCMVLDSFKPLGTQGLSQLSAGYSNIAWAHRGVWIHLQERGFFDGVVTSDMSTLEAEIAVAEQSRRAAVEWIMRNPHKALLLFPFKIFHEFRPYSAGEAYVGALAVLGMLLTCRSLAGRMLGGLVLINALAVGATWSVEGRFLVPLLFVWHVYAAIGAWALLRGNFSPEFQHD